MNLFNNEQEKENVEKQTTNKLLKVIIVILTIALVLLGSYKIKDSLKNETNVTNQKEEKEEAPKLSDLEIQEIFNKYNLYTNWLNIYTNEEVTSNFYKNNKEKFNHGYSYFYENEISGGAVSESMKFAISLGNLYAVEKDNGIKKYKEFDFKGMTEIDFSEVNNKSLELFGSEIITSNIVDDQNNIIVSALGTSFKYDSNSNKIISAAAGIGDGSSIDYYTKIINSKLDGQSLEITNKVMFVVCGAFDSEYCYISKTNQNISNVKDTLAKIEVSKVKDINIDDYIDRLDSYKWGFLRDHREIYVLDSVEKVK